MAGKSERNLYAAHPAMFRNNPISFTVACLLAPFGIGLLILFRWWLKCMGTTLTVTEVRTVLRRGILSRDINEVLNKNIRNVQVKQSFFQRLFGVGYLAISTSGQADLEIEIDGIRDPLLVKRLIDSRGTEETVPRAGFDFAGPLVLLTSAGLSTLILIGLITNMK